MMNSRAILLLLVVVTALIALSTAQSARKPNPPPRFTAKVLVFDENQNLQMSMQLWYNWPEKKFKNQQFDMYGNEEALVLARNDLGKEYTINTTTSTCQSSSATPPQDLFAFLATANYNGTRTLSTGQKCNYWIQYTGDNYVGACFVGDIPLRYDVRFTFFDSVITIQGSVVNMQPTVAPNAFDVPSFCRNQAPRYGSNSADLYKRAIRSIFF